MRHFFTFGAVLVAASACGGTTTIGEGRGLTQTDGGPADWGTGAKGTAGSTGQTGGKSGGGVGQAGTGSGVGGVGAVGGATGGMGFAGSTATLKCQTKTDCLTPGTCRGCPDGSQICDEVVCENGLCATLEIFKSCPSACNPAFCPAPSFGKGAACCLGADGPCGVDYGTGCAPEATDLPLGECKTDRDCPIPPMACMLCGDGTCAPTFTRCTTGKCESGYNACPSGLRWYQTCGDSPLCNNPPPDVPKCNPAAGEKETGPCPKDGMMCDPGFGCGILLQCHLPSLKPGCPK
jgi:hypothetical protein